MESERTENVSKKQENLEESISQFESKVDGINNTSKSLQGLGNKIEKSAKSVDEANVEYVGELSKAADILRRKTNDN